MIRKLLPLVAIALVACPGPPGKARKEPVVKPVRGGILSVALAEDVDFLDPQRAGQPAALALMRAMHRGLMAFPAKEGPEGLEPVPDLADAPPVVSADGLIYRFHIRDGAAFGPPASRALTANDARAGIARLLRSDSPYAGYYKVIASVAAPDAGNVVLMLTKPVNDLLSILAHPAASAIPSELETQRRPLPAAISPSGPYALAASDGYRPEASIHLVRNTAWRIESDPIRPAYAEEIRVRIGGTQNDITRSIDEQRFDFSLDIPPPPVAEGSVSPSPARPAIRKAVPSACLRYLWMNATVAPFNDARVRRAVAQAIDRNPLVAAAGGPEAAVATFSPLVRGIAGATAEPVAPSPDPAAAAAVFRSLPARGFSSTIVVGDRPVDLAHARAVVDALRAAGAFPIRISSTPIASVYVDFYEIPAKKVPMGIATWCADWPGLAGRTALTPLLDGRTIKRVGNQNYAQLRDAVLDRLLDAATVAPAGGAAAAWRAAAARVTALAPIVPLLDLNEVSLVGERIGGFVAPPMYPRGDLTAIWIRAGAAQPESVR